MSQIRARTTISLRALSLALAGVLAGFAVPALAQVIGNPSGHEADPQILPVWNTRSGKVEALLLLSPEQQASEPLDRWLSHSRVTSGIGFGISMQNGSRVQASLEPESSSGLALLCSQGVHVAAALGGLGQQCLLAQMGAGDDQLLTIQRRNGAKLDTRWQSASGGLDLSFGLSWLDSPLQTEAPPVFASPAAGFQGALPRILPPVLGEISTRQAHWKGSLALGNEHWMSMGGTLGTHQLNSLIGAPLRWDNATVTLGVGFRGFSGHLTGRLIELPANQGSISGLDLGFSWRTPWQGELSFGAQNLLNQNPDTSKWPLSELPALEVSGGRTPYVRYKQDL